METLFKTAFAAVSAALLIGAAPVRTANPLQLMNYIIGTWNCTSAAGGQTNAYTATYSYAMGGNWLRTVNASKNSTSEDMMTYNNGTWQTIDMEPTGASSVLEGPDTGLAHIALQTKYPGAGLKVTFDRQSMTHYTLTFTGTQNGKPVSWTDTCTKSS